MSIPPLMISIIYVLWGPEIIFISFYKLYDYQLCDTHFNLTSMFHVFNSLSVGQCYSCKNQGIDKLKHPSRGGYSKGYDGAVCNHLGEDSSDEEDDLM